MRVHELAERAGVSSHAVRYYDRLGLLDATREPDNRYRQFDRAALNRMRSIRSAKKLGFTLSEIQGILAMGHAHESPCPTVREIVRKRIRENAAHIRELVALQGRLEAAEKRWTGMLDRAPDGHAVCHLIEDFAEDA